MDDWDRVDHNDIRGVEGSNSLKKTYTSYKKYSRQNIIIRLWESNKAIDNYDL